MSMSYIGGADGPTSIFLAGKVGVSWINLFGLIIFVLIMIPNIIYFIKFKDAKNLCTNRVMNLLEQIGRYASMLFMVLNIGITFSDGIRIKELGFSSVGAFLVYLFGNALLILIYWIVWLLYFIKQNLAKSMALAIIPTCIFLLCGIILQHVLLVISAIVFGVGHIYVTFQNGR